MSLGSRLQSPKVLKQCVLNVMFTIILFFFFRNLTFIAWSVVVNGTVKLLASSGSGKSPSEDSVTHA